MNVDHVATIRQARLGRRPDPVAAARACEQAGADSIVCHLREDRRHIQDGDVARMIRACRRVNLEMSAAPAIVRVALRLAPWQVTLVPERRRELTTEGGLDVRRARARLSRIVRRFHAVSIGVSLFVDPDREQLAASRDTGARIVELHTGCYADARPARARRAELSKLVRAAREAHRMGVSVAAGHGLDYENVRAVAAIREIEELNIGFSIISRALFVGITSAVREMLAAIR